MRRFDAFDTTFQQPFTFIFGNIRGMADAIAEAMKQSHKKGIVSGLRRECAASIAIQPNGFAMVHMFTISTHPANARHIRVCAKAAQQKIHAVDMRS